MKVADLIEELKYCNPEAEVHFSYNYGDHWRTQVAPKVDSVEEAHVVWSEYHSMPKIAEYDGDEEDAETLQTVVVLG
jgi:hypothetical protein